jgi:hypothetical protein
MKYMCQECNKPQKVVRRTARFKPHKIEVMRSVWHEHTDFYDSTSCPDGPSGWDRTYSREFCDGSGQICEAYQKDISKRQHPIGA